MDISSKLFANAFMQVAVTMICGKKVADDEDKLLKKMKILEQLASSSFTAKGLLLDFLPWIRHFGYPACKRILVF